MTVTQTQTQVTIAARMDRLPIFSLHRKLALVLGLGTFFDIYEVFLGGVIGAVLAKLYNLTAIQTAAVIGSGFLGMFIGAIVMSSISDYAGRRTMYMVNLFVYSIFSLAAAFAPNVLWIIAFRFLAGVGLGSELPLTDAYMGEMLPKQARGRYTAWAYTIGYLGVPVSGFAGKFLVPTNFLIPGWRWLFVLGSLGALIIWSLRRNLPESPRWLESRNRSDAADAALRKLEQAAMSERRLTKLPEPANVVVETQKRLSFGEMFRGIYAKRTTMLWIFQLLQTVGYSGAYRAEMADCRNCASYGLVGSEFRLCDLCTDAHRLRFFVDDHQQYLLKCISHLPGGDFPNPYAWYCRRHGLQLQPSYQCSAPVCRSSAFKDIWSYHLLHWISSDYGDRLPGCGSAWPKKYRTKSGECCPVDQAHSIGHDQPIRE